MRRLVCASPCNLCIFLLFINVRILFFVCQKIYLGMDPEVDEEFLWIAKEALFADVPEVSFVHGSGN